MSAQFKRLGVNASLLTSVISLLTFTVALAASGDLDTTFSGDGRVTTNFSGRLDVVTDVALQSNGKIVVAGISSVSSTGSKDFALARYDPNGSMDTTFSRDGKLITNFGGKDEAWAVALQSDGKIIAAGFTCDNTSRVLC